MINMEKYQNAKLQEGQNLESFGDLGRFFNPDYKHADGKNATSFIRLPDNDPDDEIKFYLELLYGDDLYEIDHQIAELLGLSLDEYTKIMTEQCNAFTKGAGLWFWTPEDAQLGKEWLENNVESYVVIHKLSHPEKNI